MRNIIIMALVLFNITVWAQDQKVLLSKYRDGGTTLMYDSSKGSKKMITDIDVKVDKIKTIKVNCNKEYVRKTEVVVTTSFRVEPYYVSQTGMKVKNIVVLGGKHPRSYHIVH